MQLDASASSDPDGDAITFSWNFGDGATGTGATPTHTYSTAGSYSVIVRVTDVHGAYGTASTSVVVVTVQEAVTNLTVSVNGLVSDGKLSQGGGTALNSTLAAAVDRLNAGNDTAAVQQMNAFIQQVRALVRPNRFSQADAQRLTAEANRIIAIIESQ